MMSTNSKFFFLYLFSTPEFIIRMQSMRMDCAVVLQYPVYIYAVRSDTSDFNKNLKLTVSFLNSADAHKETRIIIR